MRGGARPAPRPAAAVAVEDRLHRALAIVRVVVTLNAVGLNLYRRDNADHPIALALVVAVMVVWTGCAIWAYADARRRTPVLLGADLTIALACLVASPVVKGADFNATITGFWVMGALLAWAIHWHVVGGLVAGVLLSTVDLGVRDHIEQANYGNVFLLLIGGPVVGYLCQSLTRMAAERDAAERAAAAAAERARLARAVHDGVLQVLALVQRRGSELGAQGAELASLAGQQERSLRSLIRQQDTAVSVAPEGVTDLTADLTADLERLVTAHLCPAELAGPGVAVGMSPDRAEELVAVVSACLDNALAHGGPTPRAWVLLEAHGDRVVVSVRDDGPGIPEGRLDEARAQGRLGVASSIRGRIDELGGTAHLDTGPHGTEWELEVPR